MERMRWSFSRVNSIGQCKYAWYLTYIEERDGEPNIYSLFGSFCHKVIEMYANGELEKSELPEYYKEYFDDEITDKMVDVDDSQLDKYFHLGLDYFENCDLDFDTYEVLGVELECNFKIQDYDFIGYIDLLLRHKETNEIIIVDNKSSEYPLGKRGKVKKKKEEDYIAYKRQLYLYAIYVKDKYGVFPSKIAWNYFKERQWLELPFIEEELNEAKRWALASIEEISKEEEFEPTESWFYCKNLCNFRYSCEYKNM